MSRLSDVLRLAISAFERHDVGFAVVGGLAVSAWVEPRFTRDVDVAVALPDDAAVERLVHALLAEGWRMRAQIEQEAMDRLAGARLAPPHADEEEPSLDVLFASSGIEGEIVAAAARIAVVEGVRSPVARIGHLLATQVLARDDRKRPQDRVDLVRLLGVATAADMDEARASLRLIEERGFHRGRDLGRCLDDLLREVGRG